MNKVKVSIVGSTGYVGAELVHGFTSHPGIEFMYLTSETFKGKKFSDIYPVFRGVCDKTLVSTEEVSYETIGKESDLVITALPHGVSSKVVPQLIEAGCRVIDHSGDFRYHWNMIDSWGTLAMMPVFQMLGTDYKDVRFVCSKDVKRPDIDAFMEMSFIYPSAIANIKIGNGVKAEGDLIVSGTKGYIYVPAPWWKTDYFEIRYEDTSKNARYFYQLKGEGIRFELVVFVRSVREGKLLSEAHLEKKTAECISKTISTYYEGKNVIELEQ